MTLYAQQPLALATDHRGSFATDRLQAHFAPVAHSNDMNLGILGWLSSIAYH